MAHTITVTDSTPDATPRTYTAPVLPDPIREVLLAEFDIALVDLDLAPDEFPFEITDCLTTNQMMSQMMELNFKQVTADEWAEFLSSFRTYATESFEGDDYHSVMYDKLSQGPLVGTIIGVVHYHHDGTKTYEIADMPNDEVQK